MTTYKLTTDRDRYDGDSAADTFSGPGGGDDLLSGRGGNDSFVFEAGQAGLADGGTGQDTLHMVGPGNTRFEANLTIVGIETLIVDAPNLMASVDQLDGFTKIDADNGASQFSLFLQGKGGSLDFSKSFTGAQKLSVEAVMADSAVKIVGSGRDDALYGSGFSDTLNGFKGNDTIYGGLSNDKIDGGLGRDHLYGAEGKDTFVFDTKLGTSNVDRIGDFRTKDDAIQIENSIFKWSGQKTGEIKASEFKVIGDGQKIDANDHIIYNHDTGGLYYDVDGKGGKSMVKFASLDNYSGDIPTLTYHDILVV